MKTTRVSIIILLIVCCISWSIKTIAATYDPLVEQVQKALGERGYNPGQIDGKMGGETAKAIKNFQKDYGLLVSGEIDKDTLGKLGISNEPLFPPVVERSSLDEATLQKLDISNKEIKIGVYYPMTGPSAVYGEMGWKGLELARQERPEVLGRKVKPILEDYKSNVWEAGSAVSRLIKEKGVVALIGGLTPDSTLAGANIAEEAKIPMISPWVTNPELELTRKYYTANAYTLREREYVFRTCFTDDDQGKAAARFAHNRLKVKLVAIMEDIEQPYAKRIVDSFARTIGRTNVMKTFFDTGQKDFSTQLSAIACAKPDLIYIAGYPNEIVRIMTQARELGINIPFMAGDVAETPDLINNGGEAMEGLYVTSHFGVRPSTESFMITGQLLAEIQASKNSPDDIWENLNSLRDLEIIGSDKFLETLNTKIGDGQTDAYKSLLLDSARIPRGKAWKVHTRFVQLFQQTYNQKPDSVSALSWDVYNLLLDAIERADSTEPESIMDGLKKTTDFESVTGWLTFLLPGYASSPVIISKVKDGKFVYISGVLQSMQAMQTMPPSAESKCPPGEEGCW